AHFPSSIDFQISATDSISPINSALLLIKYNSYGYQHQRSVTVQASRSITLDWKEETKGDNFHPPGTKVSYYWQLRDTLGDFHTGATQEFVLNDTRFTWQHLSQNFLQVNWYNRSQDFGHVVLSQATNSLTQI